MNELDSTCGVSDDELTERFKEAIRIDNGIKRIKGVPIAGYDLEKKLAYLEYPDGRREYATTVNRKEASGGGDIMKGRLTWQEIQTQYPDQWVGLVEVKYLNDDGVSIESAVVKYTDLSKGELTKRMLDGEIISRFTTPDNVFQMGMVEVHG